MYAPVSFVFEAPGRGMPLVIMVSTNFTSSECKHLLELLEQWFRSALEIEPGGAKP